MSKSAEQQSLQRTAAAYSRWSKADPVAGTVAARKAFTNRFLKQVDPDDTLEPLERARRAECARKAYFLGLALKSAQVRRERAQTASTKKQPDNQQVKAEVAALRSEEAATKLAEYITRVVDAAPPLTAEQQSRLTALFTVRVAA